MKTAAPTAATTSPITALAKVFSTPGPAAAADDEPLPLPEAVAAAWESWDWYCETFTMEPAGTLVGVGVAGVVAVNVSTEPPTV
jgi:hypothetical protein